MGRVTVAWSPPAFLLLESWKGVTPIPTLLQPLLCPGHPVSAAAQAQGPQLILKLCPQDLLLVLPLPRAAGGGE